MCDAGQDLTETIRLPDGNVFFIVVSHNGTVEGSYGRNSVGVEIPTAGGLACRAQDLTGVCF